MAQIERVDYAAKRIYLHSDTMSGGFNVVSAYFEIGAMAAANTDLAQNYRAPLSAEGNVPKGGGKYTPAYGLLATGWRFVPFGGIAHNLRLLKEIISEEGISDRETFDRSLISVQVDIDADYPQVETVVVTTGGSALAADERAHLLALANGLLGDERALLLSLYRASFNRRRRDPTTRVITLYGDDGTTPLAEFDSNSDLSEITPR